MKITDEKLYELCRRYGAQAKEWRQKFVGLLPEVNRRRLYEKKGFGSIFEFAGKLAGLSNEQVRLVLRLDRKFEDKPALHDVLVAGKVGLCKLARVASLANGENEAELAEKVMILPQKALETLVRDERNFESQNGLDKPLFEVKSVRAHGFDFEVSEELTEELNRMHEQGQDVNKILLELLRRRKENIENEKEKLAGEAEITNSRYISVKVRSVLKEEFGQKCSISTCQKRAKEIHHTQRFAPAHTHDPRFLAPLCKEHHQLAHFADKGYMKHVERARAG